MRAYQFAMYLALVGCIIGAIDYSMAYTVTPWFPGTNVSAVNDTTKNVVPQNIRDEAANQVDNDQQDGGIARAFSIGRLAWSIFNGVFNVQSIILKTINVPDPLDPLNPDGNLFKPFAFVIQLGIWVTYLIGGLQYWNKMMLKYAY